MCAISDLNPNVYEICAFWDFTQRRVVTPHRSFGTNYQSFLQISSSLATVRLLDPLRWERQVFPKIRYGITIPRCVNQKSINRLGLIRLDSVTNLNLFAILTF